MSLREDPLGAPAINIDLPKREAVSMDLARRLVDYLVRSGQFSVGDRLPSERQLSESLGIGRSAVREALKSLSFLGLVDIRMGSGTYLKAAHSDLLPRVLDWGLLLGRDRLRDLVEADLYLEPAVARLAARHRSPADLAELASLLARVDEPGPTSSAHDVVLFHIQLAAAAKNDVLMSLMRSMQALLEAWTGRVMEANSGAYPGQSEHLAIYEAVARGDEGAASLAMIEHLQVGAKRLSDLLEQDWQLAY